MLALMSVGGRLRAAKKRLVSADAERQTPNMKSQALFGPPSCIQG